MGSSTRRSERTRDARSECPPSAKKSSVAPTRPAPSSCAQSAASTSSVGVRGATSRPLARSVGDSSTRTALTVTDSGAENV
ncbi:MAG TPA: hypothetical protein VHG08_27005 [Longimicrobium sp.]|nr:hypothetical protein [Longimicrobium sp.]